MPCLAESAGDQAGGSKFQVGVIEPDRALSAGAWRDMAAEAITGINSRGALPLLVGGTGMWISAILNEISLAPPADRDAMARIEKRIGEEGPGALWQELDRVDPESAERIECWINEAIAGGARLIAGGNRKGRVLEPTLLADVKPDMKVCFKEAFAPLAVVFRYREFADVVREINNSEYGLQAGIFTNRLKDIFHAFKYLEVGGVMINDISTYRADHQPYGGMKKSGVGREGVRYAIEDMTEIKILGINLK